MLRTLLHLNCLRGQEGGVEASGFGGHPTITDTKLTEEYMAEVDSTENMEKTAFLPQKTEQKGKFLMNPMVNLHGSRRTTRPPLKKQSRWWGNLWECRRSPRGVSHPKLLGLEKWNRRPHHDILAKDNHGVEFG